MSDPDKDWLEEELANLRDMQAPPTLLPKVMERVRSRDRQRFPALVSGSYAYLTRLFMVALSVCLLAGLMVLNPSQYLHALPVASAVVRIIDVLLESVTVVLLQTKIYRLHLVTVVAPIALFSYAFLVTTASIIKRLLALRK